MENAFRPIPYRLTTGKRIGTFNHFGSRLKNTVPEFWEITRDHKFLAHKRHLVLGYVSYERRERNKIYSSLEQLPIKGQFSFPVDIMEKLAELGVWVEDHNEHEDYKVWEALKVKLREKDGLLGPSTSNGTVDAKTAEQMSPSTPNSTVDADFDMYDDGF